MWSPIKTGVALGGVLLAFIAVLPLSAQYQGDQSVGFAGLKAGSLSDPGIYVTLPLYFRQSDISLYDSHGNRILKNLTAGINQFDLPGIQVVTPYKFLGAHYGVSYLQYITNGVVSVASADFHRSTNYTFGDIYVQPIILGWNKKRFDVTAAYAFFAPTGKDSGGQHMWVNEIDLGGTFYPFEDQRWNVSTMMYYDFDRKKNDAGIRVGNFLTIGGGIGRSFYKGEANAGIAYNAQWKATRDSGADIPTILPLTNGRVFALGPQIDFPAFSKPPYVGTLSFCYMWLVGAKTAVGGQALTVSITFGRVKEQ
jgi:hypothetical protein